MPVSVIIPSFNRREELCQCIDSVLTQDYTPIEIIVVDDASTDDTVEYLKSHHPKVVFIPCEQRYGPSYLRNLGINAANGEYLLFLDSDVILPDKSVIGRMVEILRHDRNIGEIGGEIPISLGIYDRSLGKRRDFFGKNHDVVTRKGEAKHNESRNCTYLVPRAIAWYVKTSPAE